MYFFLFFVSVFFDQLLDLKICLHKQIENKEIYQKAQVCYSVSALTENKKITGYKLELNLIFCYHIFQQNLLKLLRAMLLKF